MKSRLLNVDLCAGCPLRFGRIIQRRRHALLDASVKFRMGIYDLPPATKVDAENRTSVCVRHELETGRGLPPFPMPNTVGVLPRKLKGDDLE